MRTGAAALAGLLALGVGGCADTRDAGGDGAASCAGPQLDDAHGSHRRDLPPPTVAPGDELALHGEWYTSTCNDTGGVDDPLEPLPDVTLTVTYPDGSTALLGPLTPAGDHLGFDATVDVPRGMSAGEATVSDGRAGAAPYAFRVGAPDPGAPPVTLELDGERVRLDPWSYCYRSACADGAARPPFAEVGERDAVAFSFPGAGWRFTATFRDAAPPTCARSLAAPVRTTGAHTFEVAPAGPAGRWYVDLFGRGPDGGDVATTFRWTTTADGALPGAATGTAAVLASDDGALDSYGVELWLQDLATTPIDADARITVTAAGGGSVTLAPHRRRGCTGVGAVSFTGPASLGRRATALGDGPFAYDVDLTLDGTTYHGTGTWPDDESPDEAPTVPLRWSPELPAYRG
jgi:hypothetical protein